MNIEVDYTKVEELVMQFYGLSKEGVALLQEAVASQEPHAFQKDGETTFHAFVYQVEVDYSDGPKVSVVLKLIQGI